MARGASWRGTRSAARTPIRAPRRAPSSSPPPTAARSSRARARARLASARAGNVIGGGDWGEDRLHPGRRPRGRDRAPLRVRNPERCAHGSTCSARSSGYLQLAQALSRGNTPAADRAGAAPGTSGPRQADARPVSWIVQRLTQLWGGELRGSSTKRATPRGRSPGAGLQRGRTAAGLAPGVAAPEALELVVEWHRAHRRGEDMRRVSLSRR